MNYAYWQWYHARTHELQMAAVRGPVANQNAGCDNKRAKTRRWC